jgi:hypothetical protein
MGQFIKGKSGFVDKKTSGKRGRPKGSLDFDTVLAKQLVKSGRVKQLADALIDAGLAGSVPALKLAVERLSGRPRASVEPPKPVEEKLTGDQINARLAELLARPEVKERFSSLLAPKNDEQEKK